MGRLSHTYSHMVTIFYSREISLVLCLISTRFFNDVELKGPKKYIIQPRQKTFIFTVRNCTPSDDGIYHVHITNGIDYIKQTTTLFVKGILLIDVNRKKDISFFQLNQNSNQFPLVVNTHASLVKIHRYHVHLLESKNQ